MSIHNNGSDIGGQLGEATERAHVGWIRDVARLYRRVPLPEPHCPVRGACCFRGAELCLVCGGSRGAELCLARGGYCYRGARRCWTRLDLHIAHLRRVCRAALLDWRIALDLPGSRRLLFHGAELCLGCDLYTRRVLRGGSTLRSRSAGLDELSCGRGVFRAVSSRCVFARVEPVAHCVRSFALVSRWRG